MIVWYLCIFCIFFLLQSRNVDHLLSVAEIEPTLQPLNLTMDDFEKICLTFKLMCDKDPKIRHFTSPEIAPMLLENQPMELLQFGDKSGEEDGEEEEEIPRVVFREQTDNFFPH